MTSQETLFRATLHPPIWATSALIFVVTFNTLPAIGGAMTNQKSVEQLQLDAAQGDARAQCELGDCYYNGRTLPQDYVEAVKWYRKAADQGFPDAQYALGNCYCFGRAVSKDNAEAAKWYRKAADRGLAGAQRELGVCYSQGDGVPKDHVEAVKWFRKAAEQGNPPAQACLAESYSKGEGVPQDDAAAAMWYQKSAESGHAPAQAQIGFHYARGKGVPESLAEAIKWYRRAAEQGDRTGQNLLGLRFAEGLGVPQDYVEAHKWLNLASAQGSDIAKTQLNRIQRLMTPDQIAEAQHLAREFVPRHEPTRENPLAESDIPSSPNSSGSGFFITEDGFVITNEHVVGNSRHIRLLTSAGFVSATLVKVDKANDLAVLKAEGCFVPLPIVSSQRVRLGSTVVTIGFPNIGLQGFAPKLARGEIASLTGIQDDPLHFQISVPVQPGNSGGALVDERGNVIGIVSAKLSATAAFAATGALPENVNYAVKSSFLLGFLESIPELADELKAPETRERKFEDVAEAANSAAVLVLVY